MRELCRTGGGPSLGAADIVLEEGEGGALAVAGCWNGRLPVHLRLAIASSGDLTLAMAWQGRADADLGFDAQETMSNALVICQPMTGEAHERYR